MLLFFFAWPKVSDETTIFENLQEVSGTVLYEQHLSLKLPQYYP